MQNILKENFNNISFERINYWLTESKNYYLNGKDGQLTWIGKKEQYEIAKRFFSKYESLLFPYDSSKNSFQNTQIQRTAESAQSFSFGIYENKGQISSSNYLPIYSFNNPYDQDILLRPFDMCPAYSNFQKENSLEQYSLWIDKMYPQITLKLTKNLGFNITNSLVNMFFEACAFDFAILKSTSNWCSLFDSEDFWIINYALDLKDYYELSFGNQINLYLGVPLLQEWVKIIECKKNQKCRENPKISNQKTNMLFAHAETLLPFVSTLGIYKDSFNLMADTPMHLIENRKFKTSFIIPFSSNLALFTYNCTIENKDPLFLVKLIHNEREIEIPNCKSDHSPYCDFNQFKSIYSNYISSNFSKLCEINQQKNATDSLYIKKFPFFYFLTALVFSLLFGLFILSFVFSKRNTN